MLSVFYNSDSEIAKAEGEENFAHTPPDKILWIDLQSATESEKQKVEAAFKLDFDQLKSENVLESNARFYEAEDLAFIIASFINMRDNRFESTSVYFYLLGNVLITERNADLVSFAETIRKMKRKRKMFQNGSNVLEIILETKVDLDSDFVEQVAKESAVITKKLSQKEFVDKESVLLKISEFQEAATLARESFVDKQRVISSLLKADIFEDTGRFKMLLQDINAMLEYTSFIFQRLDYLQNTILGLIDIEQNKSIKIFTIVAVIFMPPTLIASIYGMNFKHMPELEWIWGYPFAISLIVISSLLTLYIFKRNKWL
jgi:magnesium transporter